jgi:hypothetical protein
VFIGALCLFGIWLLLGAGFLVWRADYRKRVQFGAHVLPRALDPLLRKVPPHVAPEQWAQTVVQTQSMLVRLARSGALSQGQIEALRQELERQTQAATQETAIPILIQIWTNVETRAKPILAGFSYPPLLVLALAARPLWEKAPQEVTLATWHHAVDEVYTLLTRLAASGQLTPKELESLSREVLEQASLADPRNSRRALAAIWSRAASHLPNDRMPPRPEWLDRPEPLAERPD